jgi:hypothetical protein
MNYILEGESFVYDNGNNDGADDDGDDDDGDDDDADDGDDDDGGDYDDDDKDDKVVGRCDIDDDMALNFCISIVFASCDRQTDRQTDRHSGL